MNIMKIFIEFDLKDLLPNIHFPNSEILAYIIAVFHFIIGAGLISLVFISHTFYTAIWLKVFVFVCLLLIWLQHVILDICIFTVWEKQLITGEITPFHQIIKDILGLFNLTLDHYYTNLVIVEGVAVGCFGLELVSYLSDYIKTVSLPQLQNYRWPLFF